MLFLVLLFGLFGCGLSVAFVNTTCNPLAQIWTAQDPLDTNSFFVCTQNGYYERQKCPVVNGVRKVFVPAAQECLLLSHEDHVERISNGAGSQTVGSLCRITSDCLSGAACLNGTCFCLPTHVNIGGYCWRKINPEEPGCTYQEQCTSVWPNAQCTNNVCKCPFNRPPAYTKDGTVCYSPGECPINGPNPKLIREDNSNSVGCTVHASGSAPIIGCGIWSEIYDCIDSSETHEGYCCPSRALSCSQPLDAGTPSPSFSPSQRFYYHSVTQSCQPFNFLGTGGNSNNFLTIEQCESYCRQGCPRGQPQYSTTKSATFSPVTQICDVGCGKNYQCNKIGTSQTCCPEQRFICSPSGGLVAGSAITNKPFNQGFGSYTGSPSPATRYYWDVDRRQCLPFKYLGQGGNFNNFVSQLECEAFCAPSLCKHGDPLTDPTTNANIVCIGQTGCPSTHECTNGVCCPTQLGQLLPRPVVSTAIAETTCTQPRMTGGCSSYSLRYWFNSQTQTCEEFQYSGCQGNTNNFATLSECLNICSRGSKEVECLQGTGIPYQCSPISRGPSAQSCPSNFDCYFDGRTYGCCPTKAHTCNQPLDLGRACSKSSSTRWYFDTTSRTCRSFQYLGCDGNWNNFALERDCRSHCAVSGCPDGGEAYSEANGQPRVCTSSSDCPSSHTCDQGGQCCPRKASVCSLPRDPGSFCGQKMTRFAYNFQSRSCEPFEYGGCFGNANNFPTIQACASLCNSAACGLGEIAYVDPNSKRLFGCGSGSGNGTSCPTGFSCSWDALQGRGVCCGSPDTAACPTGQKAFNSITGSPRQCSPRTTDSCPPDYTCVYNPSRNLYYCCGGQLQPAVSAFCPNDNRVFTDTNTGQPRPCTLNAPDVCPSGFTCQSTTSRALYGHCCSGPSSANGCPSGFEVSLRNGLPQACSSSSSCPLGAICNVQTGGAVGMCCSPLTPFTTCPNGTPGFISPVTGRIQTCGPSSPCPDGYDCVTITGQSICCAGSSDNPECPSGTLPSALNGRIRTCVVTADCLLGHECVNRKCCPIPAVACSSPFFAGTPCDSSGPVIRYFFNSTSGTCLTFAYVGCNGNGNNFKSLSACQAYCGAKADKSCPSGERPLITKICSIDSPSSCPSNHYCASDDYRSSGYCCPLLPIAITACPTNGRPVVNPNSGQPQLCILGDPKSCPLGYACTRSKNGGAYCCESDSSTMDACPNGYSPVPSGGTGSPLTCRFFGSTPCPSGSRCVYSNVHTQYICCQGNSALPTSTPDECGRVFTYPGTNQPLRCTRDRSGTDGVCPQAFRCAFSSIYGQDVCCQLSNVGKGIGPAQKPIPSHSIDCAPGTTLASDGATCLPELNPGQFGCVDDNQCIGNGGRCDRNSSRCLCRPDMILYEKFCVFECPTTYVNINGVCTQQGQPIG